MKKTTALTLLSVVWLLCLGLLARGQTSIPILGQIQVCEGTEATYTITPTPGLVYYWTVSANGTIISSDSTSADVYWGIAGAGTVSVDGYDTSNVLQETGLLNVTVLAKPEPLLTTQSRVACQKLNDSIVEQQDIPPPFADTGCIKVCAYSCVVYYATGAPGSSFTWAATGAVSITPLNPNGDSCLVCWDGPGTGNVSVTETTVDGCIGDRTLCIDIIESPIAHIVAMPDTNLRHIHICDSTEVIFIDKSTSSGGSPIVTWRWDFGDGTYSNEPGGFMTPITHQYTTTGGSPADYWAKLTVTNACGCSTTDSIHVHVDPMVRLKIECPRVVCQGDTGHYSIPGGCPSGNWSVIGGVIIPPVTGTTVNVRWSAPPADGFGYVMYDASSCGIPCPTAVAKVPIVMRRGVIVGETIVCPYTQYLYRLPQWPTTEYNWSIVTGTGATLSPTDQRNEIVINTNNPGTITLVCDYTNTMLGCGGRATLVIKVLDPEVLVGPDRACHLSTVNYYLQNGSSGNWILTKPSSATQMAGGNSINALFDEIGTYKLEVTGTTFCPLPPMFIKVDPLPPPPDNITGPDSFCKGVEMKFKGGNDLPGMIYNWGMANGTVNAPSGDESFIKMNLTSGGPFIIYLWRETKEFPFCKSDSITKQVYPLFVNHSLSGPTTVCPSSYHNYSQSYTLGETYEWSVLNPLDGSVASGQGSATVQVLWNTNITTAKLICKMRRCFDIYYDTIDVNIGGFPAPAFTALPGSVCDDTWFTASLNTGGTGVTWDFGCGTAIFNAGASVNYRYQMANIVNVPCTVTATIHNPWGCPNTPDVVVSLPITVRPTPRASITSSAGAPDAWGRVFVCTLPITLTANAGTALPISTYQWFYNGVPTGGTAINEPATNFGYYFVTVTNTTSGCSYTSDTIFVIQRCPCNLTIPASTSITSAINTDCGEYTFTGTHSTTGYVPGSTTWSVFNPISGNFDGFASGEFGAVGYFGPGGHTIRYCAAFNDGTNTCVRCNDIGISLPYSTGLDVGYDCNSSGGGRGTTLTGSAAVPGTTYDFYVDNMVTPVQSSTSDNYYGYLTPGSHSTRVILSLPGNFPCTTDLNIVVPALPVAAFTHFRPVTCEREASVFLDNVSTPSAYLDFYEWDFGDGSYNNETDVYKVYQNAGFYNVKLTVRDEFGCYDDVTHTIEIAPDNLEGVIDIAPKIACEGTPISLSYLPNPGTGYATDYYWKNDLVTIAHTTYQPINVFESGYYRLDAENAIGCTVHTPGDTAVVIQVPDAYVIGDPDQCTDVPYTLNGYAGSGSNITYDWIVDGSYMGHPFPTYQDIYATGGVHTYQVAVTITHYSGTSCTDISDPFTVTVHNPPPAPTPLNFNILNCNTYEVELTATPPGPGTLNWSHGATGTPAYSFAGGKYQVTFTDQYGCVSKASIKVPKDPKVYLWIFPTGCWSICTTNHYRIVGPIIPFARWEYTKNGAPIPWGGGWIPMDYNTLNIDAPGTFNLFLDNGYCSATSGNMYVDIFGCGNNGEGKSGILAETTENGDSKVDAGPLQLLVSPNPASNSTRIDYTWTNEGKNRCLEVYDMTGRLINKQVAETQKGSWTLSLDKYIPGVYQVVMKQDGKVLLHTKLSIVK